VDLDRALFEWERLLLEHFLVLDELCGSEVRGPLRIEQRAAEARIDLRHVERGSRCDLADFVRQQILERLQCLVHALTLEREVLLERLN
jgi:hypothetical protein